MLLRLIRLTRPLVPLLALCAPSLVQADTCDPIFVGQQPPALVNPNLAQRTTLTRLMAPTQKQKVRVRKG